MKRTIVILALVTAFVLAFTAVAQATWRGFTPVRTVAQLGGDGLDTIADPAGTVDFIVTTAADRTGFVAATGGGMNGFITFPEARGEMNRNLGSTPWIVDASGDPIQAATSAMILFYEYFGNLHNPGWTGAGDTDANRWNTSGANTGQGNPAWDGFTIESRTLAGSAGNFREGGAFAAFGHRAEYAAAIQSTAHGGYVTATTKCVVCHSVHRATGLENPNAIGNINNPGSANQRNQNQAFLTAGANSCVECHVIWGSQPSRLLVEWGGPWGAAGTSSGGPHAAPGRGCTMCHNAGIHGLTSSRFNVMNVFMLGNTRRGSNPALDNRDDQIAAEMHLWTGADSRGNVVISAPTAAMNADFMLRTTAQQNQTWWYDGNRALGPVGGLPTLPNGVLLGGTNYGAARSMATAYTCSEAGCHTTGAFFLTNWGVGFDRADSVRRMGGVPNAGNDNAMVRLDDDIAVTGHVTPSTRVTTSGLGLTGSETGNSCGPCHGGSPAGFPTASTIVGMPDISRRSYGCDQCHDMVGVATNSTAWPHGNRNIVVYEWTADGQQLDAAQTLNATGQVIAGPNIARAGNLWMYAGSIARSADAPNLTGNASGNAPGMGTGANIGTGSLSDPLSGSSNWFRGPTSQNQFFADQSWFVMTNVGSGRYGVPSNAADTLVSNAGTGLVDGSCLKCHVALDSASFAAAGAIGADAIRHTWNQGGSPAVPAVPPVDGALCSICGEYEDDGTCLGPHDGVVAVPGSPAIPAVPSTVAPSWNGNNVTGSQRLFLYR